MKRVDLGGRRRFGVCFARACPTSTGTRLWRLGGPAVRQGPVLRFSPGVRGHVRDARGVCKVRPRACGRVFAPVCGCDRHTYGNACVASAAGVSVLPAGGAEAP